jgi:hypothetical protein
MLIYSTFATSSSIPQQFLKDQFNSIGVNFCLINIIFLSESCDKFFFFKNCLSLYNFVTDYHAKQHNQSSEKQEKSEFPEAGPSSSTSGQEAAPVERGDARIQLLAFSIRSNLKIECPMVVIDHGRLRHLSHISKVPPKITTGKYRIYIRKESIASVFFY